MYQNFTSRLVRLAAFAVLTAVVGCAAPEKMQNEQAVSEQVVIPVAVQREYSAALMQLEAGDFVTATAQFEAFVEKHPDYAAAYINLASIYAQQQRDSEAMQMIKRALDLDSTNPVALNRLGMLKRRSGDFAGAESAWQSAIASNPDYANAWYNLGVLYDLYLQNLPAALEHYRGYQRLSSNDGSDEMVARWVADLETRIGPPPQTAKAR